MSATSALLFTLAAIPAGFAVVFAAGAVQCASDKAWMSLTAAVIALMAAYCAADLAMMGWR